MKKESLTLLSALLCLAMLMTFAVSCGSSAGKGDGQETVYADNSAGDAETETEGETLTPDDIPSDIKLDGKTVNIWCRWDNEQDFPEENGEIINDSVYRRNRSVEERLNIKISWYSSVRNGIVSAGDNSTAMRKYLSADDNTYDIIINSPTVMMSNRNFMYNLKEVPYIDLDKPWWWENVNGEIAPNANVLNFATGDMNIDAFRRMYCLYYNRTLYNNVFGSETEPYDLVDDGKWTYDVFIKRCEDVTADIDGDGVLNVENDRYALGEQWTSSVLSMNLSMCNVEWYTTDSDTGMRIVSEFNERMADWAQKCANMLNIALYDQNSQKKGTDFFEGRVLFYEYTLGYANNISAQMMDGYGLIPNPKIDESQERYQSFIESDVSLSCVPLNVKDVSVSGLVLEALASEAYRSVTPNFVTVSLQAKYADDEQSARMVNLIIDSSFANFLR